MKTYLIVGGSRGLGAALAEGLPRKGDSLLIVSRTRPQVSTPANMEWLKVDLSTGQIETFVKEIAGRRIDVFIYVAGIWESDSFISVSPEMMARVMQVNLTSFLCLVQAVVPSLLMAKGARVISVGSTSGLENEGSTSVAYAASKFGLRGATHSLREAFRPLGIPVTCISPGSLASDVPLSHGVEAARRKHDGTRIPLGDVVKLVRCVISLSSMACAKEIHLPALADTDA